MRIVIVDDHPYVRAGVRRILEQERDMVVVDELSRGDEVLPIVERERPDVVVMDINLPGSNGLHVTRRIRDNHRDTQVLILTAYHDELQVLHALRAGGATCFPKDISPGRLAWAVREVCRGRTVIEDHSMSRSEAKAWARQLLRRLGVPPEEVSIRLRPITERQMEILEGISSGLSNEEIAERLGVSRHTVKNQVYTLFRKLGVRDRTQAALYALRYGWTRLPELVENSD